MAPARPTFWLLDETTGWRTGTAVEVCARPDFGLSLAVAPTGPLALGSPDGSLGGLTLPRGVAVDACGVVVLAGTGKQPWLRRYSPAQGRFFDLPRELWPAAPGGIAILGSLLYVADPASGELAVIDLVSLERRERWTGTPKGEPWQPVDVAAHGGTVWVLAAATGAATAAVYRHRPGEASPERRFQVAAHGAPPRRLALDRAGRIYLWNGERLAVYDAKGLPQGKVKDSVAARPRFRPPAVRLDAQGRFRVPAARGAAQLFDRDGVPAAAEPAEPAGPALYASAGTWISQALDSELESCPWHRVEIDLADLPPGSSVRVSTYTGAGVADLSAALWRGSLEMTGPMQPPPGVAGGSPPERAGEGLVHSAGGRYLWLRLDLTGDGHAAPVVRTVRVHFPRESYRQYLPAVFSADGEAASFLDRFLSIVQTEWDELEHRIADMARYFDPRAVPAGPFLDYLAHWLGQPLEPAWSGEANRRLLAAMPDVLASRGTLESLRRVAAVYLRNLSGIEDAGALGQPLVLESFRTRRPAVLAGDRAALGGGATLGGPRREPRLRLADAQGQGTRLGEARVTSNGDPRLDAFTAGAHHFRLYVPAAWVRTADDESLLRRAVDSERPAHTRWDLSLVEPRLRVGVQATVGVDTVIGPYPQARLARREPDAPPSRLPRHRLGYDSVLGEGRPGSPAAWPEPGALPAVASTRGAR